MSLFVPRVPRSICWYFLAGYAAIQGMCTSSLLPCSGIVIWLYHAPTLTSRVCKSTNEQDSYNKGISFFSSTLHLVCNIVILRYHSDRDHKKYSGCKYKIKHGSHYRSEWHGTKGTLLIAPWKTCRLEPAFGNRYIRSIRRNISNAVFGHNQKVKTNFQTSNNLDGGVEMRRCPWSFCFWKKCNILGRTPPEKKSKWQDF